jgi:hypothetical protein
VRNALAIGVLVFLFLPALLFTVMALDAAAPATAAGQSGPAPGLTEGAASSSGDVVGFWLRMCLVVWLYVLRS